MSTELKTIDYSPQPCSEVSKAVELVCDIDGSRLDSYLAGCIPGLSRSAVQKLLDAGRVTVKSNDGVYEAGVCKAAAKKNHKTSRGEIYTVMIDEPEPAAAMQQDIRLDIVYEDSDVIVVNKPKGMVVHPGPGHNSGTLVNALLFHCGQSLSGVGGVMRPGIVHRIDKDTSGLIIAAKNDAAHIALSNQLASRTLKREYDAVVCGVIRDDYGTVDAPIGRHPADRKKQAVTDTSPFIGSSKRSRHAITHFEVTARYPGYTYILCSLETGRTHQIRVHMAYIGHPVLGDRVYGRKKPELGMDSQCLHARRLRFVHPASGEDIELSAELPEYFMQVLNRLEKL